ncbi:MAG: hypothetical protein RIC51_08655 [Erythrobacter sp.]|uniref:hypothetical protein n=1 Tax=Erythrobacter sp. TaxID=1042 RepID=UPI0032EC3070
MAEIDPRLAEDRALRNAALAVLKADIAHARETFAPGNLAKRTGARVKDGAEEVYDIAKDRADDNRGAIAVLVGALFLFFARQPILEIIGLRGPEGEAEDEKADDGEPEGA